MRRRAFVARIGLAALALTGRAARAGAAAGGAAARVVVVGGGFGGAACALALTRLAPRLDVTLIDAEARYHTCPTSNRVIAGMRPLGSIDVSRRGLARAGIRCLVARVAAVDAAARRVLLEQGTGIGYDRLIVAPGIRFLWERIEGLDAAAAQSLPHAWSAGAQTALLARQLAAMRPGGLFAISVPSGLMRCPPAPFERASLAAALFKSRNPRAKILILDANNRFPRQDIFTAQWRERYGAMIEWVPVVEGGAVTRVSAASRTLYTSSGAHRVDVANVIPPQAPGELAVHAGLAAGHGWCPVDPETFESTQLPGVHVIGDACIADPMPKSASAAHAQALQCAGVLAARLAGREPPSGDLDSVCYSLVDRDRALAIHGRFSIEAGVLRADPPDAAGGGIETDLAAEARNAELWYRRIVADSFAA